MTAGSETIVSVGPVPILVLLLLAAASALFLAQVYQAISGARSGSDLRVAFPLIAVALTTLFLTVQLSLPLSLGLLAALTVIRFRAPVKEPEEIAFVVALVSVAAMLATLRVALTGILLAAAVLAAFATRTLRARHRTVHGLLVVSVPAGGFDQGILPGLGHAGCWLQSISVAGTDTVLSFRFAADSESRIRTLEDDLARRLPLARATVVVEPRETLR
jgi:hypothetical protein